MKNMLKILKCTEIGSVDKMSVMSCSSTSATSIIASSDVMSVRPFEEGTNPQDCTGYTMPMFFEGKPHLELDFYLECDDDEFRAKKLKMRNEKYRNGSAIPEQDFTTGMEEKEAFLMNHEEETARSKQMKLLACTLIASTSTITTTPIRPKSTEKKKESKKPLIIFGKTQKSQPQPAPKLEKKVANKSGAAISMARLQTHFSKLDRNKPVIIICHGMLGWRNQWLIANMCSQLSKSLSCHTLRFDFTGCGHSSGQWEYGNYELDYVDLHHVVNFVQQDLHCEVACIVGHSQGSVAILRHGYDNSNASGSMYMHNHLRGSLQASPPLYVNLSGRCFGVNGVDCKTTFSGQQCHDLETKGRFTIARRGPTRNFDITMEAINNCNQYDATYYVKGINAASTSTSTTPYPSSPSKIRVLTVHGDADETVPVENAYMFKKLLSPKECHKISIIDEGNHNFGGVHKIHEVATSIAAFVKKHHSVGGGGGGGMHNTN